MPPVPYHTTGTASVSGTTANMAAGSTALEISTSRLSAIEKRITANFQRIETIADRLMGGSPQEGKNVNLRLCRAGTLGALDDEIESLEAGMSLLENEIDRLSGI
jgi:hypothetical protein